MTDKKSNDSRRKLLKSIAAGSSVVVAGKAMPESWSKPVINSIVLPAHAELTDDSGSSGEEATTTPAPMNYFDTEAVLSWIPHTSIKGPSQLLELGNLFVSEAHAVATVGMSVVVTGSNATVRYLNPQRFFLYTVVAPIDGSPSGKPVLEDSCPGSEPGSENGGPVSVQLLDYTPGDDDVRVRVNTSGNGSGSAWEVEVPMEPIGALSLECQVTSDMRLKTNIEGLQSSRHGHKLYKFQYIDETDPKTYVGVMAQDVMAQHPEAIVKNKAGYYMVRYHQLGLKMVTLEEWQNEGPGSVELTN